VPSCPPARPVNRRRSSRAVRVHEPDSVPVVAATSQGTLTAADENWLASLQHSLRSVPKVVSVRDIGRRRISRRSSCRSCPTWRRRRGRADHPGRRPAQADQPGAPPAGLQVHLAGDIAINVDQQTKSGSTGNQVELLSVVFILVLLLLIFRSLLAR